MSATATLAVARINRRIFQAAAAVAGAGVLVKFVGMSKEVVLAGIYGRSDAMDAFLAAFLIPSLLVNVVAESMNQALIPTLIRVRLHQGHAQAQELLSHSMFRMCVLLTASCALMGLSARLFFPLIASGFPAAKLNLAIHLFYALLPLVLFSGVASNCNAVLNSVENFTLPALTPLLISVVVIGGSLALHHAMGIWALVASTLLGAAIQLAVLVPLMRAGGYSLRLRWDVPSEAAREVARQYGPVFLSGIVASSGLLVDQAMAAVLPAGSVSALAYSSRFVGVVTTLLAGAISSAVLPYFSAMIAQRNWGGCRQTLRTWVAIMAAASIPVAGCFIAGAHAIVRITLQHGAFNLKDTATVAPVLAMYALQIPFFVVSRVYYRFIVSMRRTDLVLYCGVINLILDIVLNYVLMRWLGLPGIALATSLWTMSTLVFLWFWARRILAAADEAQDGTLNQLATPESTTRLCEPARYLVRIDDLCPTVDAAQWRRLCLLVERYKIKPILAVVPDNQDRQLVLSPTDESFWARLVDLQSMGATIALHGYQHLCSGRGANRVNLDQRGEFGGHSEEQQRSWIHAGAQILRAHGLLPRLFVAPRHGFDYNTIRALRAEGFNVASDGMARYAYKRHGITWIPQQLWSPLAKSKGLWTICLHPNTMSNEEFDKLDAFLHRYENQFTSFDQVAAEQGLRLGLLEWLYEKQALLRQWLKRYAKGLGV